MSSVEALSVVMSRHEPLLLDIARRAIATRVLDRERLVIEPDEFPPELQEPRACFVTLHIQDVLRGCMGCLEPSLPLIQSVAHYAVQSAMHDPRFPPVEPQEVDRLHIHLSVLTTSAPVAADTEDELIDRLRPGIDGVTLMEGRRYSTLLPQVWEHVADPVAFLGHLKRKAGLPENYWSPTLRFERYQAVSISEPVPHSADAPS